MCDQKSIITFFVNNSIIETPLPSAMVLLDFLRQEQQLNGTRAACREGDCGACLVLCGELIQGRMHYRPVNSCLLPLGSIEGRHIVTIEGINTANLNPIQSALVKQGAIQCGFCTSGLLMAITAFFLNSSSSDESLAIDAVSGNICRCTGYAGIKRALTVLCRQFKLNKSQPENRIRDLIQWQILPPWFAQIPHRLTQLPQTVPKIDKPLNTPVLVAGGTDLWVQKAPQLLHQTLDFITAEEGIKLTQQKCIISASTRIETMRMSPVMQQLFTQIEDDFKLICSMPIRHQATVGGNIVNASPIGDLSVFFLALDAALILKSAQQQRSVQLRHFFKDYKKIALQADEQLLEIHFFCPQTPLHFSFEKISKRTYLDIASVNSAMLIELQSDTIKTIYISAGGVAAIPLYLHQTCQFLRAKTLTTDLIKQALTIAQTEISPIADIRGSVAYKRLLLRQLLIAHFLKLLPEFFCWEDLQ